MDEKKDKTNILKILIINTLYAPSKVGGAEVSVQQLAEEYVAKGHEVSVLALHKKDKKYTLNGVRVIQLKIENIYWPFDNENRSAFQKLRWHLRDVKNNKYTQKISEIIENEKAELVHCNNIAGFSPYVWKIAKNKGIPVVHTLRDYYLLNPNTTLYKDTENVEHLDLFSKIRAVFLRKMSRNVDAVVGISHSILKRHTDFGFFENVKSKKVIYNGFHFQESNFDNADTIGFIGQVKEHKGINILLDAYVKLSQPKPKLVIAGKVSKELKEKYPQPEITFLGYVDKNAFFEKIKYLVVPSIWHEPFGRVVLEGILRRKIVLGSNRGAIPELLKNNSFYIFEPKIESLRDKLEQLIHKNKDCPEFKFDPKFLSQFSIEMSANEYLKLYKQIKQ